MALDPAAVIAKLQRQAGISRWLVAYSGGLDSTVLLHLLSSPAARLALPQLAAIHINHGLHPQAASWTAHCETVCTRLGVEFLPLTVTPQETGNGLEAAARDARYQAFASVVKAGDCLLTAHHADDQLETLLLRLLRGSGIEGMAGIPSSRRLGSALIYRPLLAVSRDQLVAYANVHGLDWVEDPSNQDVSLGRNYLRQQIIPQLKSRWPAAATAAARAAGHMRETRGALSLYAGQLLRDGDYRQHDNSLSLVALQACEPVQQKLMMRAWLASADMQPVSARRLEVALAQLLHSQADAQPREWLGGQELRRFRDRLYIFPRLSAVDASQILVWADDSQLELPGAGRLLKAPADGMGLAVFQRAEVRFRSGGERSQPGGRKHSSSLKKMLQEYAVPVWLRDRIPLLYVAGQLAAVGDYWIESAFRSGAGEPACKLVWEPYWQAGVKPSGDSASPLAQRGR